MALVADLFDAGAQRVLQVRGHFEGMLVRAVVQRVQQGGAARGGQH